MRVSFFRVRRSKTLPNQRATPFRATIFCGTCPEFEVIGYGYCSAMPNQRVTESVKKGPRHPGFIRRLSHTTPAGCRPHPSRRCTSREVAIPRESQSYFFTTVPAAAPSPSRAASSTREVPQRQLRPAVAARALPAHLWKTRPPGDSSPTSRKSASTSVSTVGSSSAGVRSALALAYSETYPGRVSELAHFEAPRLPTRPGKFRLPAFPSNVERFCGWRGVAIRPKIGSHATRPPFSCSPHPEV